MATKKATNSIKDAVKDILSELKKTKDEVETLTVEQEDKDLYYVKDGQIKKINLLTENYLDFVDWAYFANPLYKNDKIFIEEAKELDLRIYLYNNVIDDAAKNDSLFSVEKYKILRSK